MRSIVFGFALMTAGVVQASEKPIPTYDLDGACSHVQLREGCITYEQRYRDKAAEIWPTLPDEDADRCTDQFAHAGKNPYRYNRLWLCVVHAKDRH